MIFGSVSALIIVIFIFGWRWGTKIKNYSIVDAMWAFGISLSGVSFAILGNGNASKRLAAGALATFWGIRLGYHLQRRIRNHHPNEDTRYLKLREVWKGRETSSFFWFYQAQAVSVLVLTIPYFLIARDSSPWGAFETIGLLVAFIGIAGEVLADNQLSSFISKSTDPKTVCKAGLWRYSRHPNYFFEMVIWIGVFLFACGSAYGWVSIYAPVIITYLLLTVTGIPPAEASSVKRRGDAYRHYQETTSAFIPLPPKQPKHS